MLATTATRKGVDVVATVSGPWGRLPYVLRDGRFWYVAGSPFSFLELGGGLNGRYLVFADVLHDMLGVHHTAEARTGYVRVEDVNPLTDPAYLRRIVAVFNDRDVPFLVSVTPFFENPEAEVSVSLSERPALVEALRDAVAGGGAIVLHGMSHQYRGRTGIDAEFWDLVNRGGVAEDGEAYVRPRVEAALLELWKSDLHPIAWETPHYLATPFDYSLFSDYFSTFVERRTYGVVDGTAYQQALPYVIETDVYGGRIVPENLGYVARGSVDPERLVRNARALRVVRDATAGAFVHVTTEPSIVRRLVDQLERLGYRISDLYATANVVETTGRVELTASGSASLPVPTGSSLERRVLSRDGTLASSTLTTYTSYARPTVPLPGQGALLSLQVLSPDELAARDETGRWGLESPAEVALGALAVAGCIGLALLVATWAAVRAGTGRVVGR